MRPRDEEGLPQQPLDGPALREVPQGGDDAETGAVRFWQMAQLVLQLGKAKCVLSTRFEQNGHQFLSSSPTRSGHAF